MSRSIIILAVFLSSFPLCQAQQDLAVHTEQDVFYTDKTGAYAEVHMLISGWDSATVPGDLQVLTLAMQDTTIVAFKKTVLHAGSDKGVDRIHQERLALPHGRYELVVEVSGQREPAELISIEKELIVPLVSKGLWLSDIMLAESIIPGTNEATVKNGYNIIPYVSTYFGPGNDALNFYAEIHLANAQLGDSTPYLVTYEINQFETGNTVGHYKRYKRMKASQMEAVIASFDISDLPSGNYRLAMTSTDKDGVKLGSVSQFFQRNNPTADPEEGEDLIVNEIPVDTLYDYLLCLAPIANDLEAKMIADLDESSDMERMQSLFSNFWAARDPDDPWRSWKRYHAEVIKVNKLYGTRVREGYETDRGYVHLKFGAPNSIMDRANDMNAYPYQIWHYYKAGRYNNKRFVFYLPDLVTNDYRLIHSEVPGEVQDPRWNQTIHSRNTPREDVQGQDPGSQSADRARELFDLAP